MSEMSAILRDWRAWGRLAIVEWREDAGVLRAIGVELGQVLVASASG